MTRKIILSLMGLCCIMAAPVPQDISENLVENHEEGLLLLVPTVKVDRDGNPTKREVGQLYLILD